VSEILLVAAAAALVAVALVAWRLRPRIPREVPRPDRPRVRKLRRIARREFGMAAWGPFPPGVHRFDADVYAAGIVFFRDVYMADGRVLSRGEREVLAAGISLSNRCRYCSGSHVAMTTATEGAAVAGALEAGRIDDLPTERLQRLARFAAATLEPRSPHLVVPGTTDDEQVDMAAVVFLFHYVNRVMDALAPGGWLGDFLAAPPPNVLARRLRASESMAHEVLDAVRPIVAPLGDGDWLTDGDRADIERWTRGREGLADAVRFGWAAILRAADDVLGPDVVRAVRRAMSTWNGQSAPLLGPWAREAVGRLPDARSQQLAEQALLVARASPRVRPDALWKASGRDRRTRAVLVAFAAGAAAMRIMSWMPTPGRS